MNLYTEDAIVIIMSKKLVIVESPTKARTLSRFLGDDYQIEASMGHVRDLPKSKLGVDTNKNFEPQYVIPADKKKIVDFLKVASKKSNEIILATDPDREGEAIAWHIANIIGEFQSSKPSTRAQAEGFKVQKEKINSKFKRIVFHEITKDAIIAALKSPRSLDFNLIDAQQARRVLDRLVGYKLSPLLWKKVKIGLSAGRVQSVVLRLIVERERERSNFESIKFYAFIASLSSKKQPFNASLFKVNGEDFEEKKQYQLFDGSNYVVTITKTETEAQAKKMLSELKPKDFIVRDIEEKTTKRSPYPPFNTPNLAASGVNFFAWSSKKTMKIAQDLYEEGLITYHRTDSYNMNTAAVASLRAYIDKNFGKDYLSPAVKVYKTKSKVAQEAHEAIRPTNVEITSDKIEMSSDHKKLYDLIWKRTTATQMSDAVYYQMSVAIFAGKFEFKAVGSKLQFAGWKRVWEDREDEFNLPPLKVGDKLQVKNLFYEEKETEPPPRYSEATLIKTLDEKEIGRPSTYAPIISVVLERDYVELEDRRFRPTPLGVAVNDFLVANFGKIVDLNFTAKMEDDLDEIANGRKKWVPTVKDFFDPFENQVETVTKESERVKIFAELTSEKCDQGHPLVIRYGPYGKFLACEKFPEHKFTKSFEEKVEGQKCPQDGGEVIMKRTKKGREFFGCVNFPKCKWASWQRPQKTQA